MCGESFASATVINHVKLHRVAFRLFSKASNEIKYKKTSEWRVGVGGGHWTGDEMSYVAFFNGGYMLYVNW